MFECDTQSNTIKPIEHQHRYASKATIQKRLLALVVLIIARYFPDEGGEGRAGRKSVRQFDEEPSHALDLPELDEEDEKKKKKKKGIKHKPSHQLDLEDIDDSDEDRPSHTLDLPGVDDDDDQDSKNATTFESKEDLDTKDTLDSDDEQQGQDEENSTSTIRRPRPKAPIPPKRKIEEEEDSDEEDELELAVFSKDPVVQDKPLMSKLKGVIGVFQIIMVLKGDIEVSWPTMWTGFTDSFSFLAVNPMALPLTACAWTFSFYQKFIIIMVGPIFIVCVITPIMFLITKHCKCCPRWWPEVNDIRV